MRVVYTDDDGDGGTCPLYTLTYTVVLSFFFPEGWSNKIGERGQVAEDSGSTWNREGRGREEGVYIARKRVLECDPLLI